MAKTFPEERSLQRLLDEKHSDDDVCGRQKNHVIIHLQQLPDSPSASGGSSISPPLRRDWHYRQSACGNSRRYEDRDGLRSAVHLYFGNRGRSWGRLLVWQFLFLGRENFFDRGKKRA
jgi:hypothetical protein